MNILTYNYHKDIFKPFRTDRILKGEIIRTEIKSKANNLGIISVRFNNFEHINDDLMIYRIREKGQSKWYYQNQHKVDQFQPHGLFTFGFPLIENSKDKTYQFELESEKGTSKESVALSKVEPVLVTKHEYAKSALRSNNDTLKDFIFRKAENLIYDTNFIISSLIYILPLIFYILTFVVFEKPGELLNQKVVKLHKQKDNLIQQIKLAAIPLFFILLDILFVSEIFHTILIVITSVWVFILISFKLENRISFIIALFFLALCPFLIFLNFGDIAEKSALWAYVFLTSGVIHQMVESRKMIVEKLSS